jgi:hypothetical protein
MEAMACSLHDVVDHAERLTEDSPCREIDTFFTAAIGPAA